MATITIDLDPGESITITSNPVDEWEEPDPGEEKPEQEEKKILKAVGQ